VVHDLGDTPLARRGPAVGPRVVDARDRGEEFLRRFNSEDLGETLDFLDWHGETKMLALLEEKKKALEGARLK